MSLRHDRLVEVWSSPQEHEAVQAVHALRAEGLDAVVVGGLLAGFKVEHRVLARVLVPASQEQRARALMAEWSGDAQVDWDLVDVGEPEEDEPDDEPPVEEGDPPRGISGPIHTAGADERAASNGVARHRRGGRRRGLRHRTERTLVVASAVGPFLVLPLAGMMPTSGDVVAWFVLAVGVLWVVTAARIMGRERA